MLQVGDRVLNYRTDEEGIVSRVEGTNVVVDAADGWRWRLQSARNFFLLDDAATPPDKCAEDEDEAGAVAGRPGETGQPEIGGMSRPRGEMRYKGTRVFWEKRERESKALKEQLDATMAAATLVLRSEQGVLGENGVQEGSQTLPRDPVIDTSKREIEIPVVTLSPKDHATLKQMIIEQV